MVLALTSWLRLDAQILTENAGVTPPTIPTLRESVTYLAAENLESLRLVNQFLLGVTPQFELKLSVPAVLHQRASFRDAAGRIASEDLWGLGDLQLAAKYSLFQTDEVMESTRWAALFGSSFPTGDDGERDDGVRLPRRMQLGTGAWALTGGTAFTVIRDRNRFSCDLKYEYHTRHEGIRLGDTLDLDLAYWRRLTPARFAARTREIEVRGVIEILTRYRFSGRDRRGRIGDRGFVVWAAPGIQVYPRKDLLFEASVQLPIAQTIDDEIGDRRWGFLLAVKFLF